MYVWEYMWRIYGDMHCVCICISTYMYTYIHIYSVSLVTYVQRFICISIYLNSMYTYTYIFKLIPLTGDSGW